jgi:hypothetical protein
MKKLICILTLLLCSCVTTPQQVVTSQTVQVPVTTTCQVAYPTPATNYMAQVSSSASILDKGNAAIETALSYITYSSELLAVLEKCSTNTSEAPNVTQTQK